MPVLLLQTLATEIAELQTQAHQWILDKVS
jgi:hypothetical protein